MLYRQASTGELIGTPRYMALEQLVGAADERSDIYVVGLTLYGMATRQCPWSRKSAKSSERSLSTFRKPTFVKKSSTILDVPDVRELNSMVPQQLARVIMKACAHHPESRYQTACEFKLDLNELSYQGKADRRNSPRSRAIVSKYKARNVARIIAIEFVF